MVGALVSFSVMAVSMRELAGHGLGIFGALTIRSSGSLVILGAILLARKDLRPAFPPRKFHLHLARNGVHFAAQALWSYAVVALPLATVFSLEFTAPAWMMLIAPFTLGERLTPSRIGVVIFGLAGVLIVLRPGLETINPMALYVLAAAFGYSVTNIFTKILTRTESPLAIMFWMMVIQFPLGLAASDLHAFTQLTAANLLPGIGLVVSGLTAHFCFVKAIQGGDATVVVPIDFMRIPLIALVGWLFYKESLDIFVLVGALVIVAGVFWNLRDERIRATRT